MFERDDRWDLDSSGDEPAAGVLWPVLRNVGALIATALLAAWAFFGVTGSSDGPTPQVQQARPGPGAGTPRAPSTDGGYESTDGRYELTIPAGANGHFMVTALANGNSVRFLVDTGASGVMLTEADARTAGLRPASLAYSDRIQTANGEIPAARTTVREIRVAGLVVDNVEVWITRAPMPMSLLGMTFLRRLASYEARGDRLILRW